MLRGINKDKAMRKLEQNAQKDNYADDDQHTKVETPQHASYK